MNGFEIPQIAVLSALGSADESGAWNDDNAMPWG